MRFAKWVFLLAGVSGILLVIPPARPAARLTNARRCENSSGPMRQKCLGAPGRCFGGTNRNPCGRSDRSLLIGFVGGAAIHRAGATQDRMRRNPSPVSSGLLRLVAFRRCLPPWFEARDVALYSYFYLYPRRCGPVKKLV